MEDNIKLVEKAIKRNTYQIAYMMPKATRQKLAETQRTIDALNKEIQKVKGEEKDALSRVQVID